MKNHISFCVNNSKRLTFCFVNELQDVLRFLYNKNNVGYILMLFLLYISCLYPFTC